jgi:hypothetical protein
MWVPDWAEELEAEIRNGNETYTINREVVKTAALLKYLAVNHSDAAIAVHAISGVDGLLRFAAETRAFGGAEAVPPIQLIGTAPIPMILHCPKCHVQHVDRDEWVDRTHRTHLCASCAHEWRPANVYTVGVQELADEFAEVVTKKVSLCSMCLERAPTCRLRYYVREYGDSVACDECCLHSGYCDPIAAEKSR